jgi:hypothetical protein
MARGYQSSPGSVGLLWLPDFALPQAARARRGAGACGAAAPRRIAHRARLEHRASEAHAEGRSMSSARRGQAVMPRALELHEATGGRTAAQLGEHGTDDIDELHGPIV